MRAERVVVRKSCGQRVVVKDLWSDERFVVRRDWNFARTGEKDGRRGRKEGQPDLRDLLMSRLEENRADQAVPHSPFLSKPVRCRYADNPEGDSGTRRFGGRPRKGVDRRDVHHSFFDYAPIGKQKLFGEHPVCPPVSHL
jgi:hypothetical protein